MIVYNFVDFLSTSLEFIATTLTITNETDESKSQSTPKDANVAPVRNSEKENVVLVHCEQGKSRSASIVAFYLMKSNGWTFQKTLSYLKERRYVAPNSHFAAVLERLEPNANARSST